MKYEKVRASALAAACAISLSTVTPSKAEESAGLDVHVGKTVEITRSHSWCWFPTIHQFRCGKILVSMSMAPDQKNSEGSFSAYCISRDGGMTWGRRTTVGKEATQDGSWTEVPDQADNIWQWGSYPEPRREGDTTFYAALAKFGRGGRALFVDQDVLLTTSQPVYLAPANLSAYSFAGASHVADTRFETQFNIRPWGNIIQGPKGELLSEAYYISAEDARIHSHPRRHFRTVLVRSDDGGRTWKEYSTIAAVPSGARPAWMGQEGPTEGSLAFLPDHRLYAIYRTGGKGMIGNSWSSDGGKTWTEPASIGFEGVAPRLHRLSNGMLVLVTGRPGPVVLRFNADGRGEKWSQPVIIFAAMSTRYTDVAEIRPGQLLVVYDSVPYGWYEIPYANRDARNSILGTFVDVGEK